MKRKTQKHGRRVTEERKTDYREMEKSRAECGMGFPLRWSHAALSMMCWARKTPTYTHTHRETRHRLCNFLPPMHAVGSSPPLQHRQQQQKLQNPDLTPIPEPPKHRWVEKPSEKSCQVFIIGQTL